LDASADIREKQKLLKQLSVLRYRNKLATAWRPVKGLQQSPRTAAKIESR